MKRNVSTFLCLLCTFLVTTGYAQISDELGLPSAKSLQMTNYPLDSTAGAVVVRDLGYRDFEFGMKSGANSGDFYIEEDRHMRIKVISKDGLDQANFRIPLAKGKFFEELTYLKAGAYVVGGGEDPETVGPKDVFYEEPNKNYQVATFTVPGVQVGSIIDVHYRVKSWNLFNLDNWYFQREIPVASSEFHIGVPEMYLYKMIKTGHLNYSTFEKSTRSKMIRFMGVSGAQPRRIGVEDYHFEMKHVPAFRPEPYMGAKSDAIASLRFELGTVRYWDGDFKELFSNWGSVVLESMDHNKLGRRMLKMGFLREVINGIKNQYSEPRERLEAAYAHIAQRMKWNGKSRAFAERLLAEAYNAAEGTSSEINLMLVGMLRKLGLEAYPVLLSTRSHGKVIDDLPILGNFDYVIAYVRLGEEELLMDATDDNRSIDCLPYRCLNGRGLILDRTKVQNAGRADWLEVGNGEKFTESYSGFLTLDGKGVVSGKISHGSSSLEGAQRRNKLNGLSSEEQLDKVKEELENWSPESLAISNMEDPGKRLQEDIEVKSSRIANRAGKRIYVDLLKDLGRSENLFANQERMYPVDLGCPIHELVNLSLILPERYAVEELPESVKIVLPNEGGTFRFIVHAEGGMVQVSSSMTLNQGHFTAPEYQQLREFFGLVIEKHAEQLVLIQKEN